MIMPRKLDTKRVPFTEAQVDRIAETCHAAYAGYMKAHTGEDVPTWADLDDAGKAMARDGVRNQFEAQLFYGAGHLHDHWREAKAAEGWTYGPVKDAEAKTHPAMVPYDALPTIEKAKTPLFSSVAGVAVQLVEEERAKTAKEG